MSEEFIELKQILDYFESPAFLVRSSKKGLEAAGCSQKFKIFFDCLSHKDSRVSLASFLKETLRIDEKSSKFIASQLESLSKKPKSSSIAEFQLSFNHKDFNFKCERVGIKETPYFFVMVTQSYKEKSRFNNINKTLDTAFFQRIFESLPLGIAVNKIDDNTTVYINKKFENIYGRKAEELQNVSEFFEKVYPEVNYRKEISERILSDIASRNPEKMQWQNLRITTKSNQVKIIDAKNIPLYDQNLMISTVTDVTESYYAREELEQAKSRFDFASQATSDAVWECDLKSDKLYWGEGYERLFGYKKEGNIVSKSFWESKIHPNDVRSFLNSLKLAKEDKDLKKWTFDYRFLKKDGSYANVRENVIIIRNKEGEATRLVGALQDITKAVKREDHLGLLEKLVAGAKDSILMAKVHNDNFLDSEIIYANSSFQDLFGYDSSDIIGKTPLEFYVTDKNKAAFTDLNKKLKNWDPVEIDLLNFTKQNLEFWNNLSITPIMDNQGWYTHWVVINRDINDLKNSITKRQLLSQTHKIFAEYIPLDTLLVKVLQEIENQLGSYVNEIWLFDSYSKKITKSVELRGGKVVDLESHGTSIFYKSVVEKIIKTNEPLITIHEDDIHLEEGTNIKLSYAFPIQSHGSILGVVLLGFTHTYSREESLRSIFDDFSIQLANEISRKQAENELTSFFEYAPDFMCITGKDGYLKKVNKHASDFLGISKDEFLSTPFLEFIHNEDRNEAQETLFAASQLPGNHYTDIRLNSQNNTMLYVSWRVFSLKGSDDVYCVGRDITEKIKLEELLEKTNILSKTGTWELDLENDKTYLSENAKFMLGQKESFVGRISELNSLLNLNHDLAKLRSSKIETKQIEEFDTQIALPDGTKNWFRIVVEQEFENNILVKLFGSLQNIQGYKESELKEKKLLQEKNQILDNITDGFFVVDEQWIVKYWNKSAEEILSVKKSEILGKHLWEVFDDFNGNTLDIKYRESMEKQESIHFESYFENLKKWFEVSAYPSKKLLSIYFRDTTDKKAIVEDLRTQIEKFEILSETVIDAVWDLDIQNNSLSWGLGLKKLFGYDPKEFRDSEVMWLNKIHPEERERIQISFEASLKDSTADHWKESYRLMKSDGTYTSVLDRGTIIRDDRGKALRMVGSLQDISNIKE
ncbi:bacteriophytochrome-like histidine kinase sensor with multiple PAS domains [Psychroflexus gondwanensis ACAM 44]|jgi:PAS domain S-box-containing protein|uniref:histidine kinase n=1 Tax=Psychroflexus gondwanensis ACAM 44 TaxID=1189619 RepID=N1WU05_9FLAO|nr:PAS domain S-box protein [Psychroflexus gondwanensis]EMY80609.1 bacteriophytochrome-like histidine kinase sensor with multiple PAS domains [Psychroflexus gondwanensis ACAM 44]